MGEQAGIDWYKMGKESMQGQLGSGGKDDPLSGLDQITTALKNKQTAREAEVKAEKLELKKARNKAGQKITNAFVEMGPTLKALGQESYNQAQVEVESLRNEMFAAIDAGDQKAIADINVRLNEIKTRHSSDSESLDNFIGSYEDELVSSDAMTDESQRIHEQFAANKTKRVVYKGTPPKLHYEWDIETEEEDSEGNVNMIMKTESYTLEDLNDMIILKDSVNGERYIDQVQEWKETFEENPDSVPDDATMLAKIKEIVPTDPKQMRDWLHGNPADLPGLDVEAYLHDLLSVKNNNVLALEQVAGKEFFAGIENTSGPGGIMDNVIDVYDLTEDDRNEIIRKIMDVDDPEKSHEIVSEIYADVSKNNVGGIAYKENPDGTHTGNKDYRSDSEKTISFNNANLDGLTTKVRAERLDNLTGLSDPTHPVHKRISKLNPEEIARELGFKDLNAQIYDGEKLVSISSYITSLSPKPAIGDRSKYVKNN